MLFRSANSIFYGEKLLTTGNPDVEHDRALFVRLDLHPLQVVEEVGTVHADILETETVGADQASCGQGCGCSAAA